MFPFQALEAAKALKDAQEHEAVTAAELDRVRSVLTATLAEKAELEEALGLMERNTKDELERLQVSGPKVGCCFIYASGDRSPACGKVVGW